MFDLSIVLPTCNRADLLDRCLQSIRDTTHCSHEIIVIDGASTDRTPDVLTRSRQWLGDRLRIINEPTREGFVRASNKGFAAAAGRNICWLNDDARPLPNSLDLAVQQMDQAAPEIGIMAMFHRWHSLKNIAYQTNHQSRWYCLLHMRGTLYANFGIARRETFATLGYFDDRFFTHAADLDFSLKAWHAGLRIAPAYCSIIEHDEITDARRSADSPRVKDDLEQLYAKWDLPPKNHLRNEFNPTIPCTLRGLRSPSVAA